MADLRTTLSAVRPSNINWRTPMNQASGYDPGQYDLMFKNPSLSQYQISQPRMDYKLNEPVDWGNAARPSTVADIAEPIVQGASMSNPAMMGAELGLGALTQA